MLQLLILVGMLYDTAQLLAGRIDAAICRARMHALADDEDVPRPGRPT
ncbi:hypothetical protein [Streptomyces sp. NPDC005799]